MLRLGIVDFDSSHSIEFTRRLNHCGVDADQCVEGARVVLGCPGQSTMSAERIPGFTQQIQSCDVQLVDAPEEMLGQIDAVLVLSICGDAHLERARPFLQSGIPVYVDKPFAGSLAAAKEMFELSQASGSVLWTSSSLRFAQDFVAFREQLPRLGKLNGAISWGPAKRHPGNPGLLHYGIHAVEVLFSLLGLGCEEVSSVWTPDSEVVTGRWSDGRTGTVRGIRSGCTAYGALAFCEQGIVSAPISARFAYRNLCREIVRSFESRTPAVPSNVSLEILRFLFASLESERQQGRPVRLESIQ